MRVIKFRLDLGHNLIDSPVYLEPKWLELQDSQWTLWCCEYQNFPVKHPLEVYLATTGEELTSDYEYVTTATNQQKDFVVHLFKHKL